MIAQRTTFHVPNCPARESEFTLAPAKPYLSCPTLRPSSSSNRPLPRQYAPTVAPEPSLPLRDQILASPPPLSGVRREIAKQPDLRRCIGHARIHDKSMELVKRNISSHLRSMGSDSDDDLDNDLPIPSRRSLRGSKSSASAPAPGEVDRQVFT
ncbi:uncharacterized protein BP01DRAFT_423953 [Aspergillus saccharolyticus JOP 1030-1]|uniref:Uncharacterized protein n=1 Tax=Aspergillus saccharolyticus JOP 1030-1 TaxID=1450539 RepID=A0A318ZBR6_9EURO|nr:hypothetical protein BP01DRAFT_423953 [Aspergillus saccharolyticus JOP 1030-1]PYH44749.1 hypothetical protein BP01DRAFT_423953 [Aspergillus saccharolyticus JOP 1030-1]